MKEAMLDCISIVLVRPKFPENIGSVARAMKNMGLKRLVVAGGASPLHANAYRLASGAEDILERAEEFPTLRDALSEMECIVGTTSRAGKERRPLLTPKALAERLVALSKETLIGLVFGSEKEGLTNEELSRCHLYVRIPSSESFPSLNLSQAVMVLCYELFQSSPPAVQGRSFPLASFEQLEKMFEHMERTLSTIGFLDEKNPKRMMRVLMRLFARCGLEEKEVRILQGIWSKMDWRLGRKEVE
jgi:tRNA/rRNA methyltransferase